MNEKIPMTTSKLESCVNKYKRHEAHCLENNTCEAPRKKGSVCKRVEVMQKETRNELHSIIQHANRLKHDDK